MPILSSLIVEVTARGIDKAKRDISDIGVGMTRAKTQTDSMLGSLGKVAAVAGTAAAAIGLITKGLSGTTEGDQLSTVFTEISQEITAVLLPIIELVTNTLRDLLRIFQSTGRAGQDLALGFGLFKVFADPGVQGGIRRVVEAFGGLVKTMQPLIVLMADGVGWLAKWLMIQPLELFLKVLESVLKVASALVKAFIGVGDAVARMLGFRGIMDVAAEKGGGVRRAVTLNQTGVEGGEDLFQRLQQAALRAGADQQTPEQEQAAHLRKIKEFTERIVNWIEVGQNKLEQAPEKVIAGAQEGLKFGLGGAALNGLIRGLQ